MCCRQASDRQGLQDRSSAVSCRACASPDVSSACSPVQATVSEASCRRGMHASRLPRAGDFLHGRSQARLDRALLTSSSRASRRLCRYGLCKPCQEAQAARNTEERPLHSM